MALLIVTAGGCAQPVQAERPARLTAKPSGDIVQVLVDDRPLATLRLKHSLRPIVYPIYGPGQIPMTRNYPMRKGVSGEADDHPHHHSMWFGHEDVGGVDFWHDGPQCGRVVHERLVGVQADDTRVEVTADHRWQAADGRTVCTDTTRWMFSVTAAAAGSAQPVARQIDWTITLKASHGAVTLSDRKDAGMSIRTHPNLRLENDPDRGATTAVGTAVNSRGVRGRAVWGQRASWVDYSGRIGGQVVGVALFDHPGNLRHPTYWHARHYGLVAANPFGRQKFAGRAAEDGAYTIPAGESLTLRYRFVFHAGNAAEASIDRLYRAYVQEE